MFVSIISFLRPFSLYYCTSVFRYTTVHPHLKYSNCSDTTPPKKQVKDTSQDFYSAGFVPGAIVYFSYDLPRG